MTMSFQASLFDGLDDAVAAPAGSRPALGELGDRVERIDLGEGAWLDVRPGWVTGSDELFERLVDVVPWKADRREMYDRVVDVPRLAPGSGRTTPSPTRC
jgi:alkylated DNA repair dioxygenase AlkB